MQPKRLRMSSARSEELRLACGDPDLVSSLSIFSVLHESNVGKSSGSKSGFQCGGIERYERVADVSLPDTISVKRVGCYKAAAGSQHSMKFAEQLILRRLRSHVMQHREASSGRESIVWQWQLGAVTPDDLDIGIGKAESQVGGKIGVDLNCRDGGHAVAQKVGGQTWPGSDLQHVIAQLDGRLQPREQVGLQGVSPFGAGEILEMGSVHALLVPSMRMTVSAAPANCEGFAAKPVAKPLRPSDSSVRAGTYPVVLGDMTSSWHVHDLHQLEYAFEGVVQVETSTERILSTSAGGVDPGGSRAPDDAGQGSKRLDLLRPRND
jgi:hypothetical protein